MNSTISLCQSAYIDQILDRFGLTDAKTASTPLEQSIDLTPGSSHISNDTLTDSHSSLYREIIGSLMYLSVMTRPDITYAVSTLSRYLSKPSTTHLEAARRVIRYLKGTRDYRLVLGGPQFLLHGFTDADWGSQLHRHSISGFCFFAGGGAISWSSKKQPIVTLSSTESEYVGLTAASKEVIYLRNLAREILPIVGLNSYVKPFAPTIIYCDNQGALHLADNPVFHNQSKHIAIRYHFIRQTIASGDATVTYCRTDDMVADIFTKSLGRVKFTGFRNRLGVRRIEDAKDGARIEGEC